MLALVAALLIGAIGVVGAIAALYAGRAQASLAADASALAAAVSTYPHASTAPPIEAASTAARENGANLVECRCALDPSLRPRRVLVKVGVPVEIPLLGSVLVRSSAAAEFDPRAWLGR